MALGSWHSMTLCWPDCQPFAYVHRLGYTPFREHWLCPRSGKGSQRPRRRWKRWVPSPLFLPTCCYRILSIKQSPPFHSLCLSSLHPPLEYSERPLQMGAYVCVRALFVSNGGKQWTPLMGNVECASQRAGYQSSSTPYAPSDPILIVLTWTRLGTCAFVLVGEISYADGPRHAREFVTAGCAVGLYHRLLRQSAFITAVTTEQTEHTGC